MSVASAFGVFSHDVAVLGAAFNRAHAALAQRIDVMGMGFNLINPSTTGVVVQMPGDPRGLHLNDHDPRLPDVITNPGLQDPRMDQRLHVGPMETHGLTGWTPGRVAGLVSGSIVANGG